MDNAAEALAAAVRRQDSGHWQESATAWLWVAWRTTARTGGPLRNRFVAYEAVEKAAKVITAERIRDIRAAVGSAKASLPAMRYPTS